MSFFLSRSVRLAVPVERKSNLYWPPRFARLWPYVGFGGDAVSAEGAAARPDPRRAFHPAAPHDRGAAQPARRMPKEVAN